MVTIGEAITVFAPAERVFNYLCEPNNLPEIWPSLIEITDIQSLPDGRYSCRWKYKMAGRLFEGTAEYTEMIPNKSIVFEARGGIKAVLTCKLRTRANRTRVTITIEYSIPVPLLGKLAEALVAKMNEQEMVLVMSNLRARFMIA